MVKGEDKIQIFGVIDKVCFDVINGEEFLALATRKAEPRVLNRAQISLKEVGRAMPVRNEALKYILYLQEPLPLKLRNGFGTLVSFLKVHYYPGASFSANWLKQMLEQLILEKLFIFFLWNIFTLQKYFFCKSFLRHCRKYFFSLK